MVRNRSSAHQRTNAGVAAVAAVAADPFGPDGFGDTWEKEEKPFDSDSDEELLWREKFISDIDTDWGVSAETHARRKAEEADRKKKEEEKRQNYLIVTKARRMKEKAAFEAAANAAGKLDRMVAISKDRWTSEVQRANEALALAKPVVALRILSSLFQDDEFTDTIDMEEQGKIAQMYVALEAHYELQSVLAIPTETVDGIETQESCNVRRSTDDSTDGSDTVLAANHSNFDGEDSDIETGSTTVCRRRSTALFVEELTD